MDRLEVCASGFSGGYRGIHNRLGHVFNAGALLKEARLGLPASIAVLLLAGTLLAYTATVRLPDPLERPVMSTAQIPGWQGEHAVLLWSGVRNGMLGAYAMITKAEPEDTP